MLLSHCRLIAAAALLGLWADGNREPGGSHRWRRLAAAAVQHRRRPTRIALATHIMAPARKGNRPAQGLLQRLWAAWAALLEVFQTLWQAFLDWRSGGQPTAEPPAAKAKPKKQKAAAAPGGAAAAAARPAKAAPPPPSDSESEEEEEEEQAAPRVAGYRPDPSWAAATSAGADAGGWEPAGGAPKKPAAAQWSTVAASSARPRARIVILA